MSPHPSPGKKPDRRTAGPRCRAAGLVALALASPVAPAATVYVIDDIAVGLHAERRTDSAVLTMVRSGVELEVLERDGNLLRVRTRDGTEGWLDGNYAVDDPPARAQLRAAASTNEALHAELSALRRETDRLRSDLFDAEESRKRQIATLSRSLEGQLDATRDELQALREARLEDFDEADADRSTGLAELARLRTENENLLRQRDSSAGSRIPSATLREMQRLAEEVRTLRSALSDSRGGSGEPTAPDTPPKVVLVHDTAGPPGLWESFSGASPYALWLVGFSGLLLYGLGSIVQDWLTRRRHGGFRL